MKRHTHQERYVNRQKSKRGLVQVAVWVPADDRDKLLAVAKHLRNKAKTPTQ